MLKSIDDMTAAERWTMYELGAVLVGRRGPFPIAGASLEIGIVLAVVRCVQERGLAVEAERVCLVAQLHYGVDLHELVMAAIEYRTEFLFRVARALPRFHRAMRLDEIDRRRDEAADRLAQFITVRDTTVAELRALDTIEQDILRGAA